MSMSRKGRSALQETVQAGLPTWRDHANGTLSLPDDMRVFDRFFFGAFGDCNLPVTLYGHDGRRLVHPLSPGETSPFPEHFAEFAGRANGPRFAMTEAGLVYVFDRLERWPLAPRSVAAIAVFVTRETFAASTALDLTPSEFRLVSLLLTGHDLASAAAFVDASYDTKRKQVRLILEKAGVNGQPALLREISIALSSYILDDLLRPDQRSPEVDLVRDVYGRDVVVHSISFDATRDIPVWEFGARRGQPILYFHSMLAPIMFTPDMVEELRAKNLRLLMIPRHFFRANDGAGTAQRQILKAASEIVEYFCGEPVICMGESAGCAWAAQFTRHHPEQVSEVVFVATPQAIRPEDEARVLSGSAALFSEVSTRFRQDGRVIAGLTRIYNAIARVPSLGRKSLDFMLREAPSDLASIDVAYRSLALGEWIRLIANKAARASIDEVAHLHSDWVKDLSSLTRPMRFFHGVEDTLCPIDDARAMAAGIPGTTFRSFEDAGHLVLGQKLDQILDGLFVDQNANDSVIEQSV
ncbi:alpha/beta hydrolase [Yoonia sp. GPGPB17]|uniref:alpha/beta hydrolase n=1 Tax=Yoonia sp. GPGPB17 TaxID=3026147 RepID=UPI0030C416F1